MDFASMSNEDLAAALSERRAEAEQLFALDEYTVEQVDRAEALVADIGAIEAEQNARAEAVTDAARRFDAARAAFSNAEAEAEDEDEGDDEAEDTEAETDEAEDSEAEDGEETEAEDGEAEGEAVTTASVNHRAAQRVRSSAARKVGRKTKRPEREVASPVTITAAAGVPNHSPGSPMDSLVDVAAATQALAKTFAPWNERRANALRSSGQFEQIEKVPVAQFSVPSTNELTAKSGVAAEYDAVGESVKAHVERVHARMGLRGDEAMTAAMAWCAPSEVVYNWIADFVVDGLITMPEISAPRGGLMLTEGPRLAQEGYGQDFGFGGTEAEMEADYVKTCETIECPEFVDYRLDFDGYCWKIPILTEATFPELIADAMRTSDVLYAHKINARIISDIIAESTAQSATGFGASMLDTLEALVQIATKERRWWNVGDNAVMEVKLPQFAREIFKFDMQRRAGLALSDVATDQRVNAFFANHRLSVEYLSDFDERSSSSVPTPDWPENLRAIIYPAGTFVKAQKDVISLSAVHDAASLSANEYTGVFYEQGLKTIRRGYRSTVVTVPVCTAGATGAAEFACVGSL